MNSRGQMVSYIDKGSERAVSFWNGTLRTLWRPWALYNVDFGTAFPNEAMCQYPKLCGYGFVPITCHIREHLQFQGKFGRAESQCSTRLYRCCHTGLLTLTRFGTRCCYQGLGSSLFVANPLFIPMCVANWETADWPVIYRNPLPARK